MAWGVTVSKIAEPGGIGSRTFMNTNVGMASTLKLAERSSAYKTLGM